MEGIVAQGISWVQWVSLVELPVIGALFLLLWRNRNTAHNELEKYRHYASKDRKELRQIISDYKIEATEKFAAVGHLRDVEVRLTKHMDDGLDRLAAQLTELTRLLRHSGAAD